MSIISTTCPTGPMKFRECLAFFGVEYQTYLWIIVISLLIGFGSYFIYSKIRKIKFETRNYVIKSLLASLIIFILLSFLTIWLESQKIY
jgi:predicted PurR-regulated permease PerM